MRLRITPMFILLSAISVLDILFFAVFVTYFPSLYDDLLGYIHFDPMTFKANAILLGFLIGVVSTLGIISAVINSFKEVKR